MFLSYSNLCAYSLYSVLIFVVLILAVFFFFKQKTAYEMRISDWSSDVCSSDLMDDFRAGADAFLARLPKANDLRTDQDFANADAAAKACADAEDRIKAAGEAALAFAAQGLRSEEHTSELQSLMRISYAVFCLKKKKIKKEKVIYNHLKSIHRHRRCRIHNR